MKGFMKRKTELYYGVNIIVFLASAIWFAKEYQGGVSFLVIGSKNPMLWLIIITAVTVHMIKALRLFFIFYGSNIKGMLYMKTYCKATPVSIILPFKLGEIYKMYCCGNLIDDYFKGSLSVLLDRFVDTVALVTIITIICLIFGSEMIPLVYLLLLFLVFMIGLYFVFPGLFKFWNKYLLRTKASEHSIRALKILYAANLLYFEIRNIVKGRWTVLYLLSLGAWIIEIGSLILLNRIIGKEHADLKIFTYVTAAMHGNGSMELEQFITVSIVILLGSYFSLSLAELRFKGKRGIR